MKYDIIPPPRGERDPSLEGFSDWMGESHFWWPFLRTQPEKAYPWTTAQLVLRFLEYYELPYPLTVPALGRLCRSAGIRLSRVVSAVQSPGLNASHGTNHGIVFSWNASRFQQVMTIGHEIYELLERCFCRRARKRLRDRQAVNRDADDFARDLILPAITAVNWISKHGLVLQDMGRHFRCPVSLAARQLTTGLSEAARLIPDPLDYSYAILERAADACDTGEKSSAGYAVRHCGRSTSFGPTDGSDWLNCVVLEDRIRTRLVQRLASGDSGSFGPLELECPGRREVVRVAIAPVPRKRISKRQSTLTIVAMVPAESRLFDGPAVFIREQMLERT